MVLSNSTPNQKPHHELMMDTAAMNSEDLSELLQLNAEIEERRRSSRHSSDACGLLRATMTREELFEISSMDDDRFLSALEHQNSYATPSKSRVQVTDLDLSSIENLMKYFDEEVPVTPTKSAEAAKLVACSGKVASVIAKLAGQQPEMVVSPPKPKVDAGKVKISELKQKYEQPQPETPQSSGRAGASKSAGKLPMKVKEMAQLFNSKISQVMRRGEEPQYVQLHNEFSPEAKPQPQSRLESRQGPCLVAEEVFRELSVRDKALLFNQFVGDMAAKHPKFTAHAADLKAKVKKQMARGEVVAEHQASVKLLAQELEAKCILGPASPPRPAGLSTTSSPPKESSPAVEEKTATCTSNFHVSTLTVILKPSPERRAPQPRPRRCLERQSESHGREGSQKRNLASIRSVLPTEAFAPPKKIRRTRQERTGTDHHMFFQNEPLESLFYSWLSAENGVQFDITCVSNSEQTIEIALEDGEISEQARQEQTAASMGEVSQRSAVERLLEEAISKLEMENKVKESSQSEEKEVDTKDTPTVTPRKVKRQAPPVPAPRPSLSQTQSTCAMSSSSSSRKQSEAEESESGLSTLPKITSDESQPEMQKENMQTTDFDFAKPQRPPRKKKMRRTLTWKKENSIVEATANAITSTDSDSDYKPAIAVPTKKKNPSNIAMPEQSYIELDKSLMRQVNSPRKIKSAYTLTVMSSPSPNADSDQSPAQTPRQSLNQTIRGDSFIDQGFETCSNDATDSGSPLRRSSMGSSGGKPSGFSTPVKGRHAVSPAQQQLFSPILTPAQDNRPRRSSLAMQVIREDHPLDLDATPSSPRTPCSEREFFANAPTMEMNSSQDEMPAPKPQSMFWISAGDFTVSLEIFHNSPERLGLLYEIFTQKSWETRDMAFGIDAHKFTRGGSLEAKQSLPERPPSVKGCSHYWFASGDLAVPFSGKLMSGEKVARLFEFLDAELNDQAELRFGVDHLEFSCVPEFWPTTQKYSIESSYSMLVGLQTGASNGLEGRSKYAWPNVGSNANNTIKTSDLDQTEFESDSFSNNSGSGRLSFSPDMFSLDYEAVPLDELFAKAAPVVRTPAMSMPQMMQVLKQQQTKLKNVEQKIRSYSKPSNLADDSLEHCRNTPEYVQKLRAIIRAIDNIGRDNGFRTCSMEQLESFMYFLSEYADVCLANCSEHMDKILDTLLDRRSVEV
ncbi:nucleolar protein dao-5 [Drosophila pseudoobscura]|uniref:Nucleolar protein dao-5 n=1 Tax=Drosophila pseudoobscura pseudoobscura TaxID=46245 RepID=A0A6I8UI19_DROPS|nr:nucleolar protein dao-5 [Drosophila pseudoobscura]